jgi:hypothetical protein
LPQLKENGYNSKLSRISGKNLPDKPRGVSKGSNRSAVCRFFTVGYCTSVDAVAGGTHEN